ncbi:MULTISPECIES: hypothetical protein [unclassified Bradyrhizobium]|uniref:hypothetical protein n=1 Tax=unclassified Bradyrhizobium TaxID=2631580 RepID=UPI002916DC9F|nr:MULTISPECIES: hypothetical protein [unclassified Bradyrhizobium]
MQNRYVGDVGDFAKLTLLRTLTRETNFRLAVIWYLFADETHNGDGRHVSYLRDLRLAEADPDLHSALSRIVSNGKREVRSIARARVLPSTTSFFTLPISDPKTARMTRIERETLRATWLRKALASALDHELVFLDPDNGLETASVLRHSPKSGKYVFWNELEQFWTQGHSLIVYHHLNRTMTVARQTEILRAKFSERFSASPLRMHFLARRGSCRHFWVIGQEQHAGALERAITAIDQSPLREYLIAG